MPFLGKQPTAGFASIVKDDLTPNGSTTAFTLSKQVANANDIAVFLGNVRQEPTDAYTVSGTTLTMSEAPASGLNFYVLHIAGTVESSVVPADGTISTAKLQANAVTSAKLDTNIAVSGNLDVGTIRSANGTSAATIGSTGIFTPAKPAQSIAFQAIGLNSDTAYSSSGGQQKITGWNVTDLNIGNCWSSANSRFTPTVAGWYMFGGSIRLQAPSSVSVIALEVAVNDAYNSGVGLKTQFQVAGGDVFTNGEYPIPTGLLYCDGVDDYVEVFMDCEENLTLHDTSVRKSHFFGFLVHAT